MLDQIDVDQAPQEGEMSFLDHLEELRWHLVRSTIALLVCSILAFVNKGFVFGLILGPQRLDFWTYRKLCELSESLSLGSALCIENLGFSLMNMSMAGQFTQHIIVSFACGIILAFPYLIWEVWRFFKPALRANERRFAKGTVFFSSILFLLGALCGFYFLTPVSIQFLGNYTVHASIANSITLSSYISTVTMVTFACAFVFELPVAVYFLTKAGLITPSDMRSHRKHALLVILVLSAVITPPDITSQLLLSIPFFVLYEFSILISASVYRKQKALMG